MSVCLLMHASKFPREIASQPSSSICMTNWGKRSRLRATDLGALAMPDPVHPPQEGFNKCLNTTSGHRHTTEALL